MCCRDAPRACPGTSRPFLRPFVTQPKGRPLVAQQGTEAGRFEGALKAARVTKSEQSSPVPLHSPANSFLFRPHCFVCFESLPGKRRRLFCTDNDRRVSGIQLLSHDSASKRHQLCASSLLPSASFVLLVGALGPRVALLGPPSQPCRAPSQEPPKTRTICSLQHNTMGSRPSSVVALFYYCGGCVVL